MDDFDKDPVEYLKSRLNSKAHLKQNIWKNSIVFFNGLKIEAEKLVAELQEQTKDDDTIMIEIRHVSAFEFHIYCGSDLVVFALQTNIVTFDSSHHLMQNKYIQQGEEFAFFGQIMIYDFMADSLRYNRMEDTGYLLGRVLINNENHFMIEGVRALFYLFEGIDKVVGSEENYSLLIKKSLAIAVDSDLLAPDFSQVQFVTLGVRMKRDKELGHGKKIGFQMGSDDDPKA